MVYAWDRRIDNISTSQADGVYKVSNSELDALQWSSILAGGTLRNFETRKAITDELIKVAEIRVGITPYRHSTGHSYELMESKAYHSDHKVDDTYRPLLNGSHVSRYVCEWDGREWISYGNWLADPGEPRFFESRRLVAKQMIDWTTKRIHVGICEAGFYNVGGHDNSPTFLP